MSREILFRGKTETGEWIYWNEYGAMADENGKLKAYNIDMIRVIYVDTAKRFLLPETVGQFTGLTDKNGKKIFEGDILKVWYSSVENVGFFENLEVYYDEEYAQYKAGYKDLYEVAENSEVIGNIFDKESEK